MGSVKKSLLGSAKAVCLPILPMKNPPDRSEGPASKQFGLRLIHPDLNPESFKPILRSENPFSISEAD